MGRLWCQVPGPGDDAQAALAREARDGQERALFVVLLRVDDALVAPTVLDCERDERALLGRLSVVAPAGRGRGLWRALVRLDLSGFTRRAECGAMVERYRRGLGSAMTPHVSSHGVAHAAEALYRLTPVPPERSRSPANASLPPRRAAFARFVGGDLAVRPGAAP